MRPATIDASRCSASRSVRMMRLRMASVAGTKKASTANAVTSTIVTRIRRRTSTVLARLADVAVEAVADTADGGDPARTAGLLAELAAHGVDVDVERLRRAPPVLVPHVVDELLAGDDGAGVAGEPLEHV